MLAQPDTDTQRPRHTQPEILHEQLATVSACEIVAVHSNTIKQPTKKKLTKPAGVLNATKNPRKNTNLPAFMDTQINTDESLWQPYFAIGVVGECPLKELYTL